MGHDKVYGVCENKCFVEVLPKTEIEGVMKYKYFHSNSNVVIESGAPMICYVELYNSGRYGVNRTISFSGDSVITDGIVFKLEGDAPVGQGGFNTNTPLEITLNSYETKRLIVMVMPNIS